MFSENWPPYKYLWSRFGGRPWTHIVRDFTKDNPLVVILIAACASWSVGAWCKKHWVAILISLVCGLLAGHFWW